jgi:hypothetical protein
MPTHHFMTRGTVTINPKPLIAVFYNFFALKKLKKCLQTRKVNGKESFWAMQPYNMQ